jgi:hypothetical protein
VRIAVEHHFAASPAAFMAVLVDPDFHTQLVLPDLAAPTVLESTVDDGADVLRLRYEYVGGLDPIAQKVLAGRSLTWVQELRLDRTSGRGTLAYEAEADPKRLNGRAEVVVRGHADSCTRVISGDFRVRVPLIGGTAERRIVPGIVRRLEVEAEALHARLV